MIGNTFVFSTQEKLPPAKLIAEALVKFEKKIFYEALSIAVKNFGFIGENLSFEKAQELLNICRDLNIDASLTTSDKIPLIQPTETIKKVELTETAISYGNPLKTLKLNELKVMAYAVLNKETIKTVTEKQGPGSSEKAIRMGIMMTTGLPIGLGKEKEIQKQVKQTESLIYLDLVFSDLIRLRINGDEFDFSCLGKEKEYSSFLNFKKLCIRLAEICPKAYKNCALFDLLEGKPASSVKYESLADLEKEEKRLLLAQKANF